MWNSTTDCFVAPVTAEKSNGLAGVLRATAGSVGSREETTERPKRVKEWTRGDLNQNQTCSLASLAARDW